MFIKLEFSEEDKISTKMLKQNNQYGTKKFLKRVPSKGMVVSWIKTIIRTIDTSGTAARRPGSGRKRTVRAVDNIIDVEARNL